MELREGHGDWGLVYKKWGTKKKASMPESPIGAILGINSAYILLVKISHMVKPDVKETRRYNPPHRREAQQTFGNKDIVHRTFLSTIKTFKD